MLQNRKAASFDAYGFLYYGGQAGRWAGELKEVNFCSFLVGGAGVIQENSRV
jgi:hypothetical protein